MSIAFVLAATEHGLMIVNRNDHHVAGGVSYGVGHDLLTHGVFEPAEIEILKTILTLRRRHFGTPVVALDGGAYIGTHTLSFAQHMRDWGKVIAIEPQRYPYYALCGGIVLNNLLNVEACQGALGIDNGYRTVPLLDPTKPASFGSLELDGQQSEDIGQDPTEQTLVLQMRIDTMKLERLDLLKLDIEGMELEALQGGIETIDRCRPVIYAECIKARDGKALSFWLQKHGYTLHASRLSYLAVHTEDPLHDHIKVGPP